MAKKYSSEKDLNEIKSFTTLEEQIKVQETQDLLYSYQKNILKGLQIPSAGAPSFNYVRNNITSTWDQNIFTSTNIRFSKYQNALDIEGDDGIMETISREDLIKYISERKLIRENEVVRKMYDRYQVAIKLVGSEPDGYQGP